MVKYVFYKKIYTLTDKNPFGFDLISIAKVKEIELKQISHVTLEKMALKLEKELSKTIDSSTGFLEIEVSDEETWIKYSTDPFWSRYIDTSDTPNKYLEDGVTFNPEYVAFLESQLKSV